MGISLSYYPIHASKIYSAITDCNLADRSQDCLISRPWATRTNNQDLIHGRHKIFFPFSTIQTGSKANLPPSRRVPEAVS